jgi:endo-1,4-beta-xylanase
LFNKKKKFIVISIFLVLLIVLGATVTNKIKTRNVDNSNPRAQNILKTGDFEELGALGWYGRGNAQLSLDTEEYHGGAHSLKVTRRTRTWAGPMINLTEVLEKGKTYNISAWVKYNEGPDYSTFNIQFETFTSGNAEYINLGRSTANKGEWTLLEGDYTIPNDPNLSELSLYIEGVWKADHELTPYDTMDFYIDDVVIIETKPADFQRDIPSLKEAFKDYFPIGTATSPQFLKEGLSSEFIKYHYGVLVAGNAMKPDALQPAEGNFNWSESDIYIKYAEENNMLLRGHTLLWHSQIPNWFFTDPADSTKPVTREKLLERMENHIKTIAEKYKGKVYSWDVVNEVISDSNGLRGDNEGSKWKSIIGDIDGDGYDSDYIELAFKYAREADPDAKLIINDYGLEGSTRKRDDMYNLVKRMLQKGIPVDGVGLQMHISIFGPSAKEIEECIEKFASLKELNPDFTVEVTEMDMSLYRWMEGKKPITDELLQQQAKQYKDIFNVFREQAKKGNLSMVVLWGIADNDSWLDDFPIKGRGDAGLLFDRKLQAKPAYWSIVNED